MPSEEALLALEPDMVYSGWESAFSADQAGTRAELTALGVGTYVQPAACRTTGAPAKLTFADVFGELKQVGSIFRVDAAAAKLVAQQKAELATVHKSTKGLTALWYSSGTDTPYVGAGTGAPELVMETVGLKNVAADVKQTWSSLGWESIVADDPDVIILIDASWNTAASKIASLESQSGDRAAERGEEPPVHHAAVPGQRGGRADGGCRGLGVEAAEGSRTRVTTRARPWIWGAALGAALLLSIAVATTIGPAPLSVPDVVGSVLGHLGIGRSPLDALHDGIVWQLRLPRVLTAAAVGAGLSLVGGVMQALTRNQLADPYLLGLSSGASLGAVSVLLLGLTLFGLPLLPPVAAFGGAILALLATLGSGQLARAHHADAHGARRRRGLVAGRGDHQFRDLLGRDRRLLPRRAQLAARLARRSALAAGRDRARRRDRDRRAARLQRTRARRLRLRRHHGGVARLLGQPRALGAARRRARCSPAPWSRSAARSASSDWCFRTPSVCVVGPSNRSLLPLSALVGGIFLIWADTLARTVFDPRELPVGIVTALIGAPVFALLLTRRRSEA